MRATFPQAVRAIGKQLQKTRFIVDSDQGFVVDRVRDDYLEARYFERVSFQESVSDPLGNTFLIDHLEFRKVDFTLTNTFPELELRMAPRGLKGFTSALLKASGFSMQLEQNKVSLTDWLSAIERELATKVTIRAAIVSGIPLTGGVTAKIGLVGPDDVRRGLKELLGKHRYDLETVEIDFAFGNSPNRMVLSADSSIRFGIKTPDELLTTVRAALVVAAAESSS